VQEPKDIDSRQSLTVVARSVLLDALTALQHHGDAVVLVGAQAVYLHTRGADLGVPAYTSDGDLGIDPRRIGSDPLIHEAMKSAGFTRNHDIREPQPGTWWKPASVDGRPTLIEVDLMVPGEFVTAKSRRSVTLPPHDRNAMRNTPGLAVAMEDNAVQTIDALDPTDSRSMDVPVAGVAALLVAKCQKIEDRLDDRDRHSDKDASDVLRLMITSPPGSVAARFEELFANDRVAEAAALGLAQLRRFFGRPQAVGVVMAQRALAGQPTAATVAAVAPAFLEQMPRPPDPS
jgi:hypothetical protein